MTTHSMQPLIPDPCQSDTDAEHFFHRDLNGLSPRLLWAERCVVEMAMARRITSGVRPIVIYAVGDLVYDSEWLEERSRRLRAEERRRKWGRRAAA